MKSCPKCNDVPDLCFCPVYYADGSEVREGDAIRYKQAAGGFLPPGDWKEGIAAICPYDSTETLHMAFIDHDMETRYAMIAGGHTVEKLNENQK